MDSEPNEPLQVTPTPRPKRRRLNFACNYCRSRKTRCDEQKPSCHACLAAGVPCITTDRRRPGVEVERRGFKQPDGASVSTASPQSVTKGASPPDLTLAMDAAMTLPLLNPSEPQPSNLTGLQASTVMTRGAFHSSSPSSSTGDAGVKTTLAGQTLARASEQQEGDYLTGETPPNSESMRAATRRQNSTSGVADLEEEKRRTWWSIYCFEKLFAFELGRPSIICDQDCDQEMPETDFSSEDNGTPDFFRINISFAKLISTINQDGLRARKLEDNADNKNIEPAIHDKVRFTGESVLLLMKWANSLPEGYRPNSHIICDPATLSLAAFISLQYNNALVKLTQNSILVSEKATRHAVDIVAKDQPWNNVIRNGRSIAANAARSQVRLILETAEQSLSPALTSLSTLLSALYVLAVQLVTIPRSRLASSDLSLIENTADFAKQRYEQLHNDRKLHDVLDLLGAVLKLNIGSPVMGRNGLPGPTATMENTAWDSGFLDDISWDWGDLNSITGHAIG
ncbi:hypothetical protein NKR23_g6727 [Pleurostoma richardsiae]|uniref:Zn(2)-C6 fungal-type domain-containing protein n=1 Tax=Pleurostoma richardsiae TaxID=41990 RepID=A0AA38RPK4_9PEZI|nr:hypothetical protein NKR23_g6727 [Pleurostoma richardsiae]